MIPIEESIKYKILNYARSKVRAAIIDKYYLVASISSIVVRQGQMIHNDLVKSVRI